MHAHRIIRSSLVAVLLLVAFGGTALASHWGANGWYDRHYGYPAVPSGLAQINAVFGARCTSDSNYNSFAWVAEGIVYYPRFHKKLGGAPTPGWYAGNGGTSTNLFYDVRGHIANNHWDDRVKKGIWGYNCRLIANSTSWSTHAWGIAIDINAAYEHIGPGHYHSHTIDPGVAGIFQNHGWTWGIAFADAMHFQYATGY